MQGTKYYRRMRRWTRSNPDNEDWSLSDAAINTPESGERPSDTVLPSENGAGVPDAPPDAAEPQGQMGEEAVLPSTNAAVMPELPPVRAPTQGSVADEDQVQPVHISDDEDIAAQVGDDIGRVLVDITNTLKKVAKNSAEQKLVVVHLQDRLNKIETRQRRQDRAAPVAQTNTVVNRRELTLRQREGEVDSGDESDLEFYFPDRTEADLANYSGAERQLLLETPRVRRKAGRSRRQDRKASERDVETARDCCSAHKTSFLDKDSDYDVYPIAVAYKIYRSAFDSCRCKKIGDGSFFDAKRTWNRLLKDFPITVPAERRILSNAFEKDAQRVFEEVASTNTEATATELGDLLEVRLCNQTHRSALQDNLFNMKWDGRKESGTTQNVFDRPPWPCHLP